MVGAEIYGLKPGCWEGIMKKTVIEIIIVKNKLQKLIF